MAVVSAPVVGGAMGPAEWCRTMFTMAGGDKISSGLGVSWLSGLTVRVATGDGVVGGIPFQNITGPVDLTASANSSLYPRIDLVVARKTWPSLVVELAIKQGSAAQSPTVPAVEQTASHAGVWEMGLGYFFVPGSNGATVTDGRVYGSRGEFSEVGTPVPSPTVAPGGSVFVKSTQIEVPGRRNVSFEAWVDVECPEGLAAAGTVLLEVKGSKSFATPFKSETGGSKQVYVPILDAVGLVAGPIVGNVSVTAESGSQPVKVSRFTTRMRQWT